MGRRETEPRQQLMQLPTNKWLRGLTYFFFLVGLGAIGFVVWYFVVQSGFEERAVDIVEEAVAQERITYYQEPGQSLANALGVPDEAVIVVEELRGQILPIPQAAHVHGDLLVDGMPITVMFMVSERPFKRGDRVILTHIQERH
jgi:hypothetical protein